MIETGHRLGAGFETSTESGIFAEFAWQDLDRHRPDQRLPDGTVNRSHAAGGNQAFNLITRKQRRELGKFRRQKGSLRLRIAHEKNLRRRKQRECRMKNPRDQEQ